VARLSKRRCSRGTVPCGSVRGIRIAAPGYGARCVARRLLIVDDEDVLRLALQRGRAAAALDMSIESFVRHVAPDLRVVRRGKLRLYLVADLEAWLERNAELTLGPPHSAAGR
jgi:hypothetical protein